MFQVRYHHFEKLLHVGHGAIITVQTLRRYLIGMNAVVMDDATIGDGCIIGTLCFVTAGMEIPVEKVVVGNLLKSLKM